MTALWGILGGLVAAIALVLGGLFGGIKIERAKAAKREAEDQRDTALEVSRGDLETRARHAAIRRLPNPADRLTAASEAAGRAVEQYGRRRDD